jgi:hypothetical protein
METLGDTVAVLGLIWVSVCAFRALAMMFESNPLPAWVGRRERPY